MAEYKTHQKEALLAFLCRYRDTPMDVEEIAAGLKETDPNAPGKSTVYRLVGRLYEEGRLKRFEIPGSRAYSYQFAGDQACRRHLHMKCLGCGRLLHMDEAQSRRLLEEISGGSDFQVDQEETTLFGTCARCRAGKQDPSH